MSGRSGTHGGIQGLLFGLFQAGFKVSFGTVAWYTSSSGTAVDQSEIVSPGIGHQQFLARRRIYVRVW